MTKKTALYLQLYNDLKIAISSGQLNPGEKLPTEVDLREQYNISRDTVRRALAKLENEGFIIRKPPRGTFVKQNKSDYELTELSSFSEQMKARGISPSSELDSIELSALESSEIKAFLSLADDDKCYIISRIRLGDGVPMAYEKTYVPYRLCPDIQKYIDNTSSLFEIYQNVYNLTLNYGTINLESIIAPNFVQKKLVLPNYSPILLMKCLTFQENNEPLYYVECYYIGDKYYFSTKAPRKL